MILKEMLNLCKKKNTIIVEYYGERKFLSDGTTMMFIGNIAPDWTDEDCAVYLELTDEEKECYTMEYSDDKDTCELETKGCIEADKLRFSLNADGMPMQPFRLTTGEVIFCDMQKLRIFRDECPKMYYFKDGLVPKLYISVEQKIIGAVTPQRIDYNVMKDFCSSMLDGVRKSDERELLCANTQMSLL